jgi:hypothetical protein
LTKTEVGSRFWLLPTTIPPMLTVLLLPGMRSSHSCRAAAHQLRQPGNDLCASSVHREGLASLLLPGIS